MKLKLNLQLSFSQFHVIPFEVFYARKISDGQPGIEFVGGKSGLFYLIGSQIPEEGKAGPQSQLKDAWKVFDSCSS